MMPFAEATASRSVISRCILPFLVALAVLAVPCLWSQPSALAQSEPNPTWAGRRIVTLQGFGDYFALDANGQAKQIKPEGLGVNIVAVAARVEGDRIWIKANGAGDEPVGWVDKSNAILLDNAIPYFTSRIERSPKDWDAYLRRAESEHALNQRDAAIADYTRAIALHQDESFFVPAPRP